MAGPQDNVASPEPSGFPLSLQMVCVLSDVSESNVGVSQTDFFVDELGMFQFYSIFNLIKLSVFFNNV